MWRQYLDKFFPVDIDTQPNLLVIKDRRPSDEFVISVTLTIGLLLVCAALIQPLITSRIYWPLALFLLPALFLGVRSLLMPIGETYIFNKEQDSYSFKRRCLLWNQTTQGSLNQIRAVQIERQVISRTEVNDLPREIYRVVLLLRQGLLLGSSDTVLLREKTPLACRYENEARIASSIAGYLKLPAPETIDI